MIEINLLPEDLRAKAESRKAGINIEAKYFVYLVPFTLVILACVHLYLGILIVARGNQLGQLNKKWFGFDSQRRQLEDFKKEDTILSQDALAIKKLAEESILWSEKLDKISTSIVPGLWLTELSVAGRDFALRGSVVSLQKEEMSFIKKFIDALERDAGFFKSFNNLELGSVQRKTIGSYDVFDFTLAGALK